MYVNTFFSLLNTDAFSKAFREVLNGKSLEKHCSTDHRFLTSCFQKTPTQATRSSSSAFVPSSARAMIRFLRYVHPLSICRIDPSSDFTPNLPSQLSSSHPYVRSPSLYLRRRLLTRVAGYRSPVCDLSYTQAGCYGVSHGRYQANAMNREKEGIEKHVQ